MRERKPITGADIPSSLPRTVGRAAERVCAVRDDESKLMRLFDASHVPMMIVDDDRRHIDANRPARLIARLSLEELRRYKADDLVPPQELPRMRAEWTRLLDTGVIAGTRRAVTPDGIPIEVIHCTIARVLPGLHLGVFAPAGWPDDELDPLEDDGSRVSLSPRELEVLQLAADGLPGPLIAQRLVLSPGTVKTHFGHIYEKLGVGDRAGAVARALRLGLID